jgi:hypothetical protein
MGNIIANPGENGSLGKDRLSFEGTVKINLKEREYIEAKAELIWLEIEAINRMLSKCE